MRQVIVDEKSSGQRLDVFVAQQIGPNGRSYAKALSKSGQVLYNGAAAKPSQKLKIGDKISLPNLRKPKPKSIKLPVLYEDADVIVIDKPSGILTHSKGAYNPEPTVATFIAPKLDDLEGERAGVVHRLDRGTSGVIIAAKNTEALKYLQKQFSTRKVNKKYLALLDGAPKQAAAIIDMPIERNPKNPKSFRVGQGGKPAQTSYKVLKTFIRHKKNYSLVQFEPLTGRTHQLRVHSAKIGHPIVGDSLYGGEDYKRLMLHASELKIKLPSGETKSFVAKTPKEIEGF